MKSKRIPLRYGNRYNYRYNSPIPDLTISAGLSGRWEAVGKYIDDVYAVTMATHGRFHAGVHQ